MTTTIPNNSLLNGFLFYSVCESEIYFRTWKITMHSKLIEII